MKGDFSRFTFNPGKHYSGVLMQQGRVQLDADWNEQAAIERVLNEATAGDTIGRSGCPEDSPGFEIGLSGADLSISPGRIYVDGILVDNDSPATYLKQPWFPAPPPYQADIYQTGGYGVVYLDVWRRVVTALEDPSIREVALGGPDTAARIQTVWQVRVAPMTLAEVNGSAGHGNDLFFRLPGESTACGAGDATWDRIISSKSRTLNARIQPVASVANACEILLQTGYQRLENQLYRVEVHDAGDQGTATFKWSRENGSVVTAWTGQDGLNLRVASAGRDARLGFSAGDWVELTDDTRELNGQPGTMVRVAQVQGDVLVIQAGPTIKFADYPINPKIRRWDQQTDKGLISLTVPADNGGFIALEGGVEIQFAGTGFRTGDYWLIPARSAIATTQVGGIEWPRAADGSPVAQPPSGIGHHYARLGIIWANGIDSLQIHSDCRNIFPPLTKVGFKGIGVRDIRFLDDYPLRNGSIATVQEVSAGIKVVCTTPVPRALLRRSVFCYVTMYVPFSVAQDTSVGGLVANRAPVMNVISYSEVLLNFNILPDDNDPRAFVWQPSPAVAQSLATFMAAYSASTAFPMRFTFKPGVLAAPVGGQGPFEPVSLPEIDFFFSLVQQRPDYSYLQATDLDHLQPVILSGIGSGIL